jgi:hypothetical protein
MFDHLAAGVLAVAVVLVACRRPPHARPPDADHALVGKLDGYAPCLGDKAAAVFRIEDDFESRGSDAPLVVASTPDPEECLDAIAKTAKREPHLAKMEAAAAAYGQAYQAVYVQTAAVHGGHGDRVQLAAAFAAFDAAEGALFDLVYVAHREVAVRLLAARERKHGKTLSLLGDRMMLAAEDLVRFGATRADRVTSIDVVAAQRALDAYQDAMTALVSYANDHAKEAFPKFYGVDDAMHDYLASARQLVARARDQVAYTDAEKIAIAAHAEDHVTGTPAALVAAYNHLVYAFR